MYAAVRYVENNPVRIGMVKKAEDYRWSSAHEHIEGASEVVSGNCFLLQEIPDWRKFICAREDAAMTHGIRKAPNRDSAYYSVDSMVDGSTKVTPCHE